MAFAYNLVVHPSSKSTLFFLTPNAKRYYGESDAAEWSATLQHRGRISVQHKMHASDLMQAQFN